MPRNWTPPRFDDIRDVGIDATFQRKYHSTKQDAGVKEASGAVYIENSTQWRTDVRTVVGLREDEFGSMESHELLHHSGRGLSLVPVAG